jgi:hypothetical protein
MPKTQLDRSLDCGRSARLKCKAPSRFGGAMGMIERMLDPLETDRHRQYRRRRSKRVRYEKDRSANRAVIVIVVGILSRSLRRWPKRRVMWRDCRAVRIAGYAAKVKVVQMNVTEGKRDLQRQRRERYQRTTPLMAMNPVHPDPRPYPHTMLTG